MELITFKIVGVTPLLMHSDRLANPLDQITKAHKELTAKRNKDTDDHRTIMKSEWMSSLYYEPSIGIHIPGQNIEAALLAAAKMKKLGTVFKRGVSVLSHLCPLKFQGSHLPEELYGDGDSQFVDIRGVKIGTSKLMRCRPKFSEWALEFEVAYDPDLINKDEVIEAVNNAGKMIGLCDYRPRYGRFSVEGVA